jgi:membrane fusion protein (multidrug efflux system)
MTDIATTEKPVAAAAPAPAAGSKRRLVGVAVALAVAGSAGGYYNHARHYEDTDDAQIDGDITNVSPRIGGTVISIKVSDNQVVKAGDVMAELDPTDYEVALAQARALLAQAEATFAAENPSVSMTETVNQTSLSSAEADVSSAQSAVVAADREIKQLTAQLDLAQANAKNAVTERQRADKLLASGSISQAEVDRLTTAAEAATANVAATSAGLAGAQARYSMALARITSSRSRATELRANAPLQVDVRKASVAAREAAVALAKAQLRQAELNLGYTKILAPIAGIVGRKSLSLGDRVQPGQQIAAISNVADVWVTANFRETQVRDMKPGQRAEVKVDALDFTLHATVESMGGATGSKFSLFPPENAAGNYVKVVQRIPVRLHLDPNQPGLDRLRPGMSVEPEVLVR